MLHSCNQIKILLHHVGYANLIPDSASSQLIYTILLSIFYHKKTKGSVYNYEQRMIPNTLYMDTSRFS